MITPILRTRSPCCARAASGHATVALPSSVRSEATGSSQPISRTTASKSPINRAQLLQKNAAHEPRRQHHLDVEGNEFGGKFGIGA